VWVYESSLTNAEHHQNQFIRAARCDNETHEPLCFAAVSFLFFLFFFSARSPRSLGRSPRNFATWSEMSAILKTRSKMWGPPQENMRPKTCFLARFRTTSHFYREYLRGTRKDNQSENHPPVIVQRTGVNKSVAFARAARVRAALMLSCAPHLVEFISNLFLSLTVKELLKSGNNWRSYED